MFRWFGASEGFRIPERGPKKLIVRGRHLFHDNQYPIARPSLVRVYRFGWYDPLVTSPSVHIGTCTGTNGSIFDALILPNLRSEQCSHVIWPHPADNFTGLQSSEGKTMYVLRTHKH